MNRITPDSILEALKAHGHEPIRRTFYERDSMRCCGLTACLLGREGPEAKAALEHAATPPSHSEAWTYERDVTDEAAAALGLDRDYARGFVAGWDGWYLCDLERSAEFRAGHADGLESWKQAEDAYHYISGGRV